MAIGLKLLKLYGLKLFLSQKNNKYRWKFPSLNMKLIQ